MIRWVVAYEKRDLCFFIYIGAVKTSVKNEPDNTGIQNRRKGLNGILPDTESNGQLSRTAA